MSGSSNNEQEDGFANIAGFASAAERAAYIARMRPPDTFHGCQGRSKGAGAAGQKVEEADVRSKELRRDGEARNLS